MKSIIEKTLYAGLGLLGDGSKAVKNLGRELAKKADISEAEGEKIARKLKAQSAKAAKSMRKTLDAEVKKVTETIHSALHRDIKPKVAKTVKSAKKRVAPKPAAAKKA